MPGGVRAYWCYHCQQSFRLRPGREPLCPTCHGGFIQELNDIQGHGRSMNIFPYLEDHDSRSNMVDVISAMMSNFMRSARPDLSMELATEPWLWLRGPLAPPPGEFEVVFTGLNGGPRRGPPPAPRAAIESIPTVKIKNRCESPR